MPSILKKVKEEEDYDESVKKEKKGRVHPY